MASCMEAKPEEHSTTNASQNLVKLQTCNKDAFKFINEGLELEDRGNTKNAMACYEKGLRLLDSGLKSSNSLLGLCSEEAAQYKELLTKLTRAQKEVMIRLETLKNEGEETQSLPSAPLLSSEHIGNHVDMTNPTNEQTGIWQDVKELLNIKEGVSLFHVDGDGEVSPWISSSAVLQIFQILKDNLEKIPPAFMKCGEWVYPLDPGKSPVLKTQRRTYMFPDVNLQTNEAFDLNSIPCIGVILSDGIPDAIVKRFERILSCYGDFRKEVEKEKNNVKSKPPRPPPPRSIEMHTPSPSSMSEEDDVIIAEQGISDETRVEQSKWSDKVTAGISVGSQWISWGLLKGAEYTSVLVAKGANSLRERLKPNEEPQTVDPEISHNIRQLHQATGSVVQVSAFLVSALGMLTVNLGKKLAPHVMEQGGKLLPMKFKPESNENTHQKVADAKKVAMAGLQGLSIMFLALEQAGKNLYQSVSEATVQTMQHKYGDEVGDVTHDAMGAAGNAVLTVWNVKQLGPKAIAKRTLKDTGKAIMNLEDQEISKQILKPPQQQT